MLRSRPLVDRVQVTLFPVLTGKSGLEPIFQGAADFDLELIESRTLDGHTQELIYRPTQHVWVRPCTHPVKRTEPDDDSLGAAGHTPHRWPQIPTKSPGICGIPVTVNEGQQVRTGG